LGVRGLNSFTLTAMPPSTQYAEPVAALDEKWFTSMVESLTVNKIIKGK
jgi:hypothetical protein